MRRAFWTICILMVSVLVSAQTQQGMVKTKGRMVNGKHVAGQGLTGATVSIQGKNSVQSQANGTFSFPIPNKTFMLQGVQKKGYQLVDPDATRKAYQYSPNIFYIVMETPDQQAEDKLAAERKIRRTLQRQLQQREDEIEELKAQNKLTQEEYRKALQQLYDDQQNNEKLIADMAKEYAEMDYDQMDELNRQISDAILNGELTKADSLLRSKGDMNSRDAEITRRLEAEAKEKKDLAERERNLAASEEGTRKLLEDFAEDCYNFFKMYKLENRHDSAAYYIERRANRDTTNADWQLDAAYYLKEQNQYRKAQIYYERALQGYQHDDDFYVMIQYELANLYSTTRRYAEAEKLYLSFLEFWQRLAATKPETYEEYVVWGQNNLASLYTKTRRYAEAEKLYLSELETYQRLADSNPEAYEFKVSTTQNYLAALYSKTRRYAEAEKLYLSALEIRQHLAASTPNWYEDDVADTQNDLANLYSDTQRFAEAEKMYLSALETYQRLAASDPIIYEDDVAFVQNNLANLYKKNQRYAEAEKLYLSALETRQRLAASNPEAYEPNVALTQNNLALLYYNTQRFAEAEKMYLSALETYQRLAASNPEVYEPDVARTQNNLAILYNNTQRYAEAEKLYLSALETYQRLAASNPEAYEPNVAQTLYNMGLLYYNTQRFAEAEKMYLSAQKTYQCLAASNPDAYEPDVADTQYNLANLYYSDKRYAEAEKMYLSALEIRQRLAASNPEKYRERVAAMKGNLSFLYVFMKRYPEAEKYAREGLTTDSTKHWIATNLAAALLFQGKYDEAEVVYRQYKEELKDSILDDFKQFAEAGVIPSECEAEVEKIKQLLEE